MIEDGGVEKSYSTFEKILYIFIIPIFFTIILSLALFSLFDYNVKDTLLKFGREIPLVGQYLPAPSATSTTDTKVDEFGIDYTKEIATLNQKINDQNNELKKAVVDIQAKDQLIKELQSSVKTKDDQLKAKSLSDEEYLSKIQGLAEVYGTMSASKSAPIMESLSTEEAVLILNQMTTTQKRNVLQKMNPQRAAEISILAKDTTPTKDQQIAALQARLKLQDPNSSLATKVSKPDMSTTYANMDAKIAADIMEKLIVSDAQRVYSILTNMDANARSAIIAEMPVDLAAKVTSRIAE